VNQQPPLPLPLAAPTPPVLPGPREGEPQSEYLHRCVAVADRYWRAWWEARGARAAGVAAEEAS